MADYTSFQIWKRAFRSMAHVNYTELKTEIGSDQDKLIAVRRAMYRAYELQYGINCVKLNQVLENKAGANVAAVNFLVWVSGRLKALREVRTNDLDVIANCKSIPALAALDTAIKKRSTDAYNQRVHSIIMAAAQIEIMRNSI